MPNRIIIIALFSETILNGLISKIEKYAPRLKKRIVCGIKAL
jgi:hypothetical protein